MSWKLTARHDALRESGEDSPRENIRGFCTEGKGAHPSSCTSTTLKRSTHVSQRDGDVAAVVQGMHEKSIVRTGLVFRAVSNDAGRIERSSGD